jgi:hypothetical protein
MPQAYGREKGVGLEVVTLAAAFNDPIRRRNVIPRELTKGIPNRDVVTGVGLPSARHNAGIELGYRSSGDTRIAAEVAPCVVCRCAECRVVILVFVGQSKAMAELMNRDFVPVEPATAGSHGIVR